MDGGWGGVIIGGGVGVWFGVVGVGEVGSWGCGGGGRWGGGGAVVVGGVPLVLFLVPLMHAFFWSIW